MTVKLTKSEKVHPMLGGLMLSLFMKKPNLTFVEAKHTHWLGEQVASSFKVIYDLDRVGLLAYSDGKICVQSSLIKRERRPFDEFRTKNEKAAIRKALEVYVPEAAGNFVADIIRDTTDAIDNVRYSAYRKVPDISVQEAMSFFRAYKYAEERIPIPADIDARLTDNAIQAIDDYNLAREMQALAQKKQGYAIREDINGNFTVVNMNDSSILYRGPSTYELPEWMQSKFTILKLLEVNQVARNIGCKTDRPSGLHYFIVDGEIPNLIE